VPGHHERHVKGRLERGLVEARERSAGVRRLELRGRDRADFAHDVGVRRPVEADEEVVEYAVERHRQHVAAD